ncbi:hypothetical protein [Xanthomonas arboricola]|uniref:hypothetical protein n=1 Tax=Xanthomonas arboricola TaxID=56448 RepID=UPI00128FF3E4|nr:hypothetical protein [Xanthomonas arboricola]
MRVRITSKQKARIAAGFLFGARHSPGVQCIDHRQPSAISHQPSAISHQPSASNQQTIDQSSDQRPSNQATKQSSNQ